MPGERLRLQVGHYHPSLPGIAFSLPTCACRPGPGQGHESPSENKFTRWPEGLTTAVGQSGSLPQLAAVRARGAQDDLAGRCGRRSQCGHGASWPVPGGGARVAVLRSAWPPPPESPASGAGVVCGQRSAVSGVRSPAGDRASVLGRDPGLRSRSAGTTRPAPAGRQAHPPGGRVLLVRPGRRSASDFTIRSVSRRISALNGPTSSQ